jgi:ribosomal protein S18 acetylase RimI-like enzyme
MQSVPSPEFRIRRATVADAGEILVHRREMFRDMGYTDADRLRLMAETSLPHLQQALEEDRYRGWLVVTPQDDVIGGAGLHISELLSHVNTPQDVRRAYVYNVYVAPEHRRKGLAHRLMNELLEHCRQEGIKTVWLHASDEGRSLYEKMGFVATNEMKLTL